MEIVSGDQYEVLSFIDACNSQQHTPPRRGGLTLVPEPHSSRG